MSAVIEEYPRQPVIDLALAWEYVVYSSLSPPYHHRVGERGGQQRRAVVFLHFPTCLLALVLPILPLVTAV